MGAWKIFLGLSGETGGAEETCEAQGLWWPVQPGCQGARERAESLLAQLVGPRFTLNGHTAGGLTI